jgi:hypothetical protein
MFISLSYSSIFKSGTEFTEVFIAFSVLSVPPWFELFWFRLDRVRE